MPDGKALEILVTAFVALVGVVATFVPVFFRPGRSRLKADLEILKLLSPGDSHYESVRQAVDERLGRLYSRSEVSKLLRIIFSILGLGFVLGFGYWTYALVRPNFSWWASVTGYLTLAGFIYFCMGIFGPKRIRFLFKGWIGPST